MPPAIGNCNCPSVSGASNSMLAPISPQCVRSQRCGCSLERHVHSKCHDYAQWLPTVYICVPAVRRETTHLEVNLYRPRFAL